MNYKAPTTIVVAESLFCGRSAPKNDSKRIIPVLNRYYLFLLLSVCAVACQWEESPPYQTPPPVTEILRVEYTPMQIHTGDSVTFKVVIKDSLLTGLEYLWFLKGSVVKTTKPILKTLIDLGPGKYNFDVSVSKPNTQTRYVYKTFSF